MEPYGRRRGQQGGLPGEWVSSQKGRTDTRKRALRRVVFDVVVVVVVVVVAVVAVVVVVVVVAAAAAAAAAGLDTVKL